MSHKYVDATTCNDKFGSPFQCAPNAKCGPDCWKSITPGTPGTNHCGLSSQTPINLVSPTIDSSLSLPEFIVTDGGCDKWVQFADDHAFEVSFDEAGHDCSNLKLKYQGTEYTLLQFHFHSPGEHAIANGLGAGELHMVHKSDDGKLLVLGVIMNSNGLDAGGGNVMLQRFWDAAYDGYEERIASPASPCANAVMTATCDPTLVLQARELDLKTIDGIDADDMCKFSLEYEADHQPKVNPYSQFLPASKTFYTYSGSLTTYPCTEGVTWIVFEQPVTVNSKDIANLVAATACEPHRVTMQQNVKSAEYFYADNRPLQDIGSRTIYKHVDSSFTSTTTEVLDHSEPPLSIAAIVVGSFALAIALGLIVKGFMETKSPSPNANGFEHLTNNPGSSDLPVKSQELMPISTVEA